MTPLLHLVLGMAVFTWLLIMVASLVGAQAWTPAGLMAAFGNRDQSSPATPFAGRAERTARNTLENFVLFAAIALVAHATQPGDGQVLRGALIFVWARMAYVPVYYLGLRFVRTAVWAVSIAGLGMMLLALH
jgi:uncharacterized MAPEG superfamily protein